MKTLRKTLSKKWIAWLAAVCLLAALIPLSAVLTQAESETVYFEFLGRLPNGNE